MQPLLDLQELFDEHDTITRFYTTLSPSEMDVDPVFDFNAELPAVDNVHTAERLIHCDGTQQLTLPQGVVLQTDGTWPVAFDDELPMNLRIVQLSTSGGGEVAEDFGEDISARLVDLGVGGPDTGGASGPSTGPNDAAGEQPSTPSEPGVRTNATNSESDGGCSVASVSSSAGHRVWVMLLPLAAMLLRRSRR